MKFINKKQLILIVGLLTLMACERESRDLDSATNVRGGNCLLRKNGSDYLCLDFNEDYDANTGSNTCDTEFNRYNSSDGVGGKSWTSGNGNTCDNASNSASVGTCTRVDGVIYYYNNYWNAGAAQTDCTSIHSGTWTP